jgi:ABC-type branched-subunit amino acid transport system ATPase component
MITNLEIHNFRGLKDVTLRELRRVNLLVGGNDTGKTSVLEALILLLGDGGSVSELPMTFRSNQSGGIAGNNSDDKENFWPWLFYDRNPANQIMVSAKAENGQTLTLNSILGSKIVAAPAPKIALLTRTTATEGRLDLVRYNQEDVQIHGIPSQVGYHVSRLSVRPTNPVQDAEKYNQIALESDGEIRFEQIMREVEPRLKRLRYAKLPGTTLPLVFVDLGLSRSVPATQMGQAFNRILHIYAEILTSNTNVLLIDEIENGIFSESLPLIWRGLLAICEQQNVQIFATTHSRECVMAAHQAAKERGKDELSVQRLQLVKGNIEAVRLGEPHLEMAAEMGLEVRS